MNAEKKHWVKMGERYHQYLNNNSNNAAATAAITIGHLLFQDGTFITLKSWFFFLFYLSHTSHKLHTLTPLPELNNAI